MIQGSSSHRKSQVTSPREANGEGVLSAQWLSHRGKLSIDTRSIPLKLGHAGFGSLSLSCSSRAKLSRLSFSQKPVAKLPAENCFSCLPPLLPTVNYPAAILGPPSVASTGFLPQGQAFYHQDLHYSPMLPSDHDVPFLPGCCSSTT